MREGAFVRLQYFVKFRFCNLLTAMDPISFKNAGSHRIHDFDSDPMSIAYHVHQGLPGVNTNTVIEAATRLTISSQPLPADTRLTVGATESPTSRNISNQTGLGRPEDTGNRGRLALIIVASLLVPVVLCGGCFVFYYLFSDVGLELPVTPTP